MMVQEKEGGILQVIVTASGMFAPYFVYMSLDTSGVSWRVNSEHEYLNKISWLSFQLLLRHFH